MKLYYDNKQCDDQPRYPACRPYPYRRYCDYGRDYGRDCDHDRDYDYDRKHKDCDKDEKKCICECRECEECKDKHEYRHCCPKNPCPYPILFECACGTGARIERTVVAPNGDTGTTNFFYPRSLGCITIDTTCLKNPVVKFDFCSIIHYFTDGDTTVPVRLVFGLFKTCDEGQEVPCGTWDFTVALDSSDEQITTSFNFCHCECNSCPGCCKYSVRLVEAVNVIEGDKVDVCNVTLSAIAKSGC
ncbi:hypothetical protein JOC70_003257 [Clostridium pascui]|uniref:DUF4489 domain-containing protein n=1 Tax=Clostridium pascui TaxID=46609 RepID=UPI00195B37C7|nr:DUF4489 domain-containing protein [Clostridium pascui]MBM7871747.1 hypothetical protein [Clostridium pascui]